jgi:RecA-family ATPase
MPWIPAETSRANSIAGCLWKMEMAKNQKLRCNSEGMRNLERERERERESPDWSSIPHSFVNTIRMLHKSSQGLWRVHCPKLFFPHT